MIIQQASKNDIDAIMAIEKSSFNKDTQETEDTFLERIDTFPEGFLLLKNPDTNKITGYFSSELWDKCPETDNIFTLGHSAKKSHCRNGSVLYISSFAILPECRGKGEGALFFKCAVEKLVKSFNISVITLLVNSKWERAFKIYQNNGFKTVRTVKSFFPPDDLDTPYTDGIYMKKDLER